MAILEQIVEIVGGMGGPNGNAIPVYADNKAPNGGWVYGADQKQLMLENTEITGVEYIIVNPFVISPEENEHSKFVTYKPDGRTPNYVRLWILDPNSGEGVDYAPGVSMWVEYSHLHLVEEYIEPPEPPAGSTSVFVIDWDNRTITLKPEE